MDFKNSLEWITLFQWMAKNGDWLRDYGPTEPLQLKDNPNFPVDRVTVEGLCTFDFLRREKETTEGRLFTEFKLTDKTYRLLEVLKARESEEADLVLHRERHFWIVVLNNSVIIDLGITPPNLRALIGEEWKDGDRILITCHDPQYVRVGHLPLALAGSDPMFIDDLKEVNEDFKYADAEVEAH